MRRILLTIPVMALLVATCLLGLLVRPTSDDYRLAVFAQRGGVTGIVEEFYLRLTGRVGNGLIAGVVYADPELGMRLLPAVVVVGLAVALYFLVRNALRAVGAESRWGAWAAAVLVTLAFFWGQPFPYQTLYWAAGVITHVVPQIVLVLLCAWRLGGGERTCLWVTGAAAAVIATVSEPAVVTCLAVGGALVARQVVRRRLDGFGLALIVGAGAGMAFLQSTPGLALRQRNRGSGFSPDVFRDGLAASEHALGAYFTRPSFYGVFAVGLLLGLAARPSRRVASCWWAVLVAAAVTVGVQCGVRYGFGGQAWIFYRIWANFAFLWLLALLWCGYQSAALLRGRALSLARPAAAIVVLIAAVSWGFALQSTAREMASRARAWDAQQQHITHQVAAGEPITYRRLPIQKLGEPHPSRPGRPDWIAWAVAAYFGSHQIKVVN
ncbi:DUF6056 family protein [Actinocorallia lasiicapitis]